MTDRDLAVLEFAKRRNEKPGAYVEAHGNGYHGDYHDSSFNQRLTK